MTGAMQTRVADVAYVVIAVNLRPSTSPTGSDSCADDRFRHLA